jgi:hypothetical protein
MPTETERDRDRLQALIDRHAKANNPKCEICFLISILGSQNRALGELQGAFQRLLESDVRIQKKEKPSGPKRISGTYGTSIGFVVPVGRGAAARGGRRA